MSKKLNSRTAKSRRRVPSLLPDLRAQALTEVMIDFQMIEEALKGCLDDAYTIIKHQTKGMLAVTLTRKDVEDLALGGLVDRFARYVGGDEQLVGDLRELKKERDYCAHRAFMRMLSERDHMKANLDEYRRLSRIRGRVDSAAKRLIAHMTRLTECRRELLKESGNDTGG